MVLEPILLQQEASVACFVNLTKKEQESLEYDGNGTVSSYTGAVAEYKTLDGVSRQDRESDVSEQVKKRWAGSPLEFILHIMIMFYSVSANAAKRHPILCPRLVKMGSAFIESRTN